MPDQHSAATEHDLLATIAEPLRRLPEDPLSTVSADFPIALRGYERLAVDAYVEHTTQLVAELQSTRSPEIAVRRALERVGEEISGILQRAHDTADEITARSRSEAETRLEAARAEATELTAAAKQHVKDLDAETDRIWAERQSIVTDVRDLAGRLFELAEAALERFPADSVPAAPAPPLGEPEDEEPDAHLFDGALGDAELEEEPAADEPAPEAPAEDEPTMEHLTGPTIGLPPLEPWEGEPPVEPWPAGGSAFAPEEE